VTVKKTASKPVQVPVQDKSDDFLATTILVAALINKGHTTMSAIELAKNMVEMLREPSGN
jgi:hypothetical protein